MAKLLSVNYRYYGSADTMGVHYETMIYGCLVHGCANQEKTYDMIYANPIDRYKICCPNSLRGTISVTLSNMTFFTPSFPCKTNSTPQREA